MSIFSHQSCLSIRALVILILSFLLLNPFIAKAEDSDIMWSSLKGNMVPAFEWEMVYPCGAVEGSRQFKAIQAKGGWYILAGTVYDSIQKNDGFLLAVNEDREILGRPVTFTSRIEGKYGNDTINDVIETSDGRIVAVGFTRYEISSNIWVKDIYVNIRDSSLEQEELNLVIPSPGNQVANSVCQASDGDLVITGLDQTSGKDTIFLMKMGLNGEVKWYKNFEGSRSQVGGNAVIETADKGFILTGRNNDSVYVLKTNDRGDMIWENNYFALGQSTGNSIRQTEDGGYIICGTAAFNAFLLKVDDKGTEEWHRIYSGLQDGVSMGYDIRQTADNGYILVGQTGYLPGLYLIRTDDSGYKIWEEVVYASTGSAGYSIESTKDGGYIIGGWTMASARGACLLKLMEKRTLWVQAEPAGGTYFEEQFITLKSEPGARIYYTLDGTEPTEDSSLYAGPIIIDRETVLKFIAVGMDGSQSPVYCEVYDIDIPRITALTLKKVQDSPFLLELDIQTHASCEILYQIWAEDADGWKLVKNYSQPLSGTSFVWQPKRTENDHYKVQVRIKNKATGKVCDQMIQMATCLDLGIARINKITTDSEVEGYGCRGEPVEITVHAEGGEDLLYQFWRNSGNSWILLRDFEPSNTFTWYPEKAGNYQILARVRNRDSTQSHEMAIPISIVDSSYVYAELKDVRISGPNEDGDVYIIAEEVPGNDELEFKFSIGEPLRAHQIKRDYSPDKLYRWKADKSGVYEILTYVKEYESKDWEDAIRKSYRVVDPSIGTIRIKEIELSKPDRVQPVGTTISFTVKAEGEGLLYCFLRHEARGWRVIQDYSEKNTLDWTPVSPGIYDILVRVRHPSSGSYEDQKTITYDITDASTDGIAIDDLTVSGPNIIRTNHVIKAEASGSESLMYQFAVVDEWFGWRTLQPFSPINTCNWMPKKAGTYRIVVRVKDAVSGSYEQQMVKELVIARE